MKFLSTSLSPTLLALAVAASSGCSVAHAQAVTTTREGGYETKRWQTKARVPLDSVGFKTTDHETRVGITPETDGNSRNFAMTLGGFVKKCPTADGIVPGNFEYTLTVDEVNTDEGETQRPHYAKRVNAKLKAQLRDDLSIDYLEIEADFVSDMNGVRTGPVHDRRRFNLGQAGQPDMEALKQAVLVTGDLAVAALMWNASTAYSNARTEWIKENACVELVFDPPTETRSLGPNESAQVRTVLRTKDGKIPIDQANLNGDPLNNIGSLTPRQGLTQPDAPFTLSYTASAQPKKGHGFKTYAVSRAGIASAEWQIDDRMRFEGMFSQTESQPQRGMGVEILQTTKITGKLVWSPEQDQLEGEGLPHLPTFGDVPSTFYVPTDGEFAVEFEYDSKGDYGACRFTGSKDFPIAKLSPHALRYMLLEVAQDGRYKISLGMVAGALPTPVVNKGCSAMRGHVQIDVDSIWKDAAIVIGRREGVLNEDRIAGELSPPIVRGPSTTNGSWSFIRVGQ